MMTDKSCLACNCAMTTSTLPGLLKCPECAMVSADLDVSDAELEQIYGKDYFHGQEYFDYVAEAPSLTLNFRDRIDDMVRVVPSFERSDLFEIGCAYGFFLDTVKGRVRRAAGVDISSDAVAHAVGQLGVDATAGDYLTMDLGRQVDVITMWDTIEHLKRPDLFVKKAADDLRPGGHLALTTGDIGSFNARMRGKRWRMIHPPTHLHYFSVGSITRMLAEHGFEVVHVSHPGVSRTIGAIAYIVFSMRMNWPGMYRLVDRTPFARWRITLNLFDIMFVIARRTLTPDPSPGGRGE
jgi:SAM-dependent methyltransferase